MKRVILLAAALIMAAAVVFAFGYESKDEHYSKTEKQSNGGFVTISVSASEFVNNDEYGEKLRENGLVPDNGFIIPETQYQISQGDTVFSVLSDVLREKKIHFDYTAVSEHSAYVRGINNIYEYDCGDLSGWMYSVNGDFPTVSSSEYVLQDGDVVRWLYTCDLGRDVGDTYYITRGESNHEG